MSDLSLSAPSTVGEIKSISGRGTNVEWKVNKFRFRQGTIRSRRFSTFSCAGSAKWRLQMKMFFQKEEKEYIGLFLELAFKPPSIDYLVNCELSLYNESIPEPKMKKFDNYKYSKIGKNYGYPCFALRQDVLEKYVKNDLLFVRVRMEVYQSQTACVVRADLAMLLKEQQYGDFTLKCEGNKLKVYKGLLAVRSPYFAGLFASDMIETKKGEVEIEGIDFESLLQAIQYIYTLVVPEGSSPKKLLPVADRFQIDSLRQHCVSLLLADVRVQDACEVLVLAHRFSLPQLKKRCLELILRHPQSTQKTDGWTLLDHYPELQKDILLEFATLALSDGRSSKSGKSN